MEYQYIGKSIKKVDSVQKALGTATYINDLSFPKMLWGGVLRSVYPHARILKIDTSKAERFPMRELSLHLLDIAENSVAAGARNVTMTDRLEGDRLAYGREAELGAKGPYAAKALELAEDSEERAKRRLVLLDPFVEHGLVVAEDERAELVAQVAEAGRRLRLRPADPDRGLFPLLLLLADYYKPRHYAERGFIILTTSIRPYTRRDPYAHDESSAP